MKTYDLEIFWCITPYKITPLWTLFCEDKEQKEYWDLHIDSCGPYVDGMFRIGSEIKVDLNKHGVYHTCLTYYIEADGDFVVTKTNTIRERGYL